MIEMKPLFTKHNPTNIGPLNIALQHHGKHPLAIVNKHPLIKYRIANKIAQIGSQRLEVELVLVGLDKFGGEVGLVTDDWINYVELNVLELDFGHAQVFAIFLYDRLELVLGLGVS